MSFQRTKAINKLLQMKKRKKVVQGGTWAGKTYGIVPIQINKAASMRNKKITIAAESIPAIKAGALDDFKSIMIDTGRWNQNNYNATDRKYTFPATKSTIEFQSYDSIGKAKAAGKRTDLFLNEANYQTFEITDTLMMRTSEDIWIDFNPTNQFWAHEEILPQKDSEFLLLKYMDNEALPKTILEELHMKLEKAYFDPFGDHDDPANIKNSYWANWCKVYIDGQIGSLEGVIFNNWHKIGSVPLGANLLGGGMDFGFTNDPTTLIAAYEYDDAIIFDEVIYRRGLLNSDIAKLAKGFNAKIYADSAEPKSIADLESYGLKIEGADKGADSIRFGIGLLQEKDFYVTERSLNLIKELRAYSWAKDRKTGTTTQKPVDAFNHCIDAMRYFAMMVLNKKRKRSVKIIV